MRYARPLQSEEIQAILLSIRKEPPAPLLMKSASQAKWWEAKLHNPKEVGALKTLWHKEIDERASPGADTPTVGDVAAQIQNRSFGRPGLQAKVTRYLNRAKSGDAEIRLILEERSSGVFIIDGTTRAVALYLRHLHRDDISGLFPLKAIMFSLTGDHQRS